jgi:hypothetical protein
MADGVESLILDNAAVLDLSCLFSFLGLSRLSGFNGMLILRIGRDSLREWKLVPPCGIRN